MARKAAAVIEAVVEETAAVNETPTESRPSPIEELDRLIWETSTMHIDTSTSEGLGTHKVREAVVRLAEKMRAILVSRAA